MPNAAFPAQARGGETIALPEQISARSLSNLLGVSALEVLKTCIKMGHDTILTADDILPQEAADLVAEEFGFKAECVTRNASHDVYRTYRVPHRHTQSPPDTQSHTHRVTHTLHHTQHRTTHGSRSH